MTGPRSRIRGNGSGNGRSTTGTTCPSSRGSRRRCARSCRISCGIWADPFRPSGISFTWRTGRGTPRDSSRRSSGSSISTARRPSSPRWPPRSRPIACSCSRSRPRAPAPGTRGGRRPGRAARHRRGQRVCRRLRRLAGGGRVMSATTLTREPRPRASAGAEATRCRPDVRRVGAPSAGRALAARRLPPRGPQRGAGVAPRVCDPAATPRRPVSRGQDARHVRFRRRGGHQRHAGAYARARRVGHRARESDPRRPHRHR